MKHELTAKFDSDEAIGTFWGNYDTGEMLTDEEEGATLLPDGSPMSVCTNCAKHVIRTLGRGTVFGFASKSNPACTKAAEYYFSEGHDFAVIDDRWIVDPWISTFSGFENQTVYDLSDPDDAEIIKALYGERNKWEVICTN